MSSFFRRWFKALLAVSGVTVGVYFTSHFLHLDGESRSERIAKYSKVNRSFQKIENRAHEKFTLGANVVETKEDSVGIRIYHIQPNSLAQRANLKLGDHIIEIDGIIIKTLEDYTTAINSKPGNTKVFTILRNGKVEKIEITNK